MVKTLKIQEGKPVESAEPDASILVYITPGEAEKRHLVETYKIDEHTLNSALDPDELSRIEFEPDHFALIFKRPKSYCAEDNFLFRILSCGAFVFKDRMILVLMDDAPILEGRQSFKIASLLDLLLKQIYQAIFHFVEHLKVINMIAESLEQRVNVSLENKYLLNMFTLEKSLVYYLNAINSNGALIERLKLNGAKIGFTHEQMEILDDIGIENNQCYRQAEIHSQVLSSLMDARASIVSNNLNHLIKTLTIITIAIMAPTLVVSIFSMNVKLPMPQEESILPFWLIVTMAFASIATVFVVWKYKKW